MPADAKRIPLWILWIPIVWFVSFPFSNATREPQWHRVHPVPFTDPADKPPDVVANLLLFVPFGFSMARRTGGSVRAGTWLLCAVAAGVVSTSAEILQLFSTLRYPSGTDVAVAMAGAVAGIVLSRSFDKRHEPATNRNLLRPPETPPSP